MKRLFNRLFVVGALGTIGLLSSCSSDDPEPLAGPSIVSITTNPAAVSGVVNLNVGDQLTITVSASTPAGFNVVRISDGVNTEELNRNDLSLDAGTLAVTAAFDPIRFDDAGTSTITVTVVDDLGQTVSDAIDIVITGTPLNESTVILLGGPQNTAEGSFYNAIDETVYSATQAFMAENTSKVDFVFWYGSSSQYAIGAVDDVKAQTAFDSQAGIVLDNLNPKSISRFKTFTAIQDFDGTTTSEQLDAIYPSDGTPDLTRVGDLVVGDIFGVTLDSGRGSKKGLIKVEEIIGATPETRAIKIKVKMQP